MKKTDILYLESRRRIYNVILEYPGLHLRKLFRKLNMSEGTVKYHLRYLIKRGLIVERTEGGFNRFYVKDKIGSKEKQLLSILRADITRHVLLQLLLTLCRSRKDISEALDKDPKTIDHHLNKLKKLDLIEVAPVEDGVIYTNSKDSPIMKRTPVGNEVIYRMKDPNLIYDAFITHKGSFSDGGVTHDLLDWFGYVCEGPQPDKLEDNTTYVDRAIERIYDIFPHPYHV